MFFENRGEVVGVSNPHPHCQIYGNNFVFKTIENEVAFAREHLAAHGRTLWDDIVRSERDDGRRVLDGRRLLAFISDPLLLESRRASAWRYSAPTATRQQTDRWNDSV